MPSQLCRRACGRSFCTFKERLAKYRSLRVFLEDYQLDNGTYSVGGATGYSEVQLTSHFGWAPEGDDDQFTYTVSGVTDDSWDIVVKHDSSGTWIRCDDRMETCCDSRRVDGDPPADNCPPPD